jgi:hypothetical protein
LLSIGVPYPATPVAQSWAAVDDADRLYALPPEEFVAARDELARRLRGEGEREEAKRVKALRRPTVAAWAVNQAARNEPERLEALLAAGEALRSAHEALLAGGAPAELRAAGERERALVSELTDAAARIATEAGSGEARLEAIRSTFHAAALDESLRAELAVGRVTREREAVGVGGIGGFELLASPEPGPAKPRAKRKAGAEAKRKAGAGAKPEAGAEVKRKGRAEVKRKGRAEAKRKAAHERERARAARLAQLERELAAARQAQTELELRGERAAEAVAAAHGRLDAARAALAEAEQARREAAKRAREAERGARRLERLLEAERG